VSPRLRLVLVVVVAAVAVVVVGGGILCRFVFDCNLRGGSSSRSARPSGGFADEVVARGVSAATSFAFLPDGRVLVGEKQGVLRIAGSDGGEPKTLLDIRGRVESDQLRGLLGVAVDPGFRRNGYLYVDYVRRSTGTTGPWSVRVSRFTVRDDVALPSSEHVILGSAADPTCRGRPATADCIPVDGYHAGGDLEFAVDGTLFVTTGDGGFGDAPEPGRALRAQAVDSLSGKVLRVTRDGRGLPSNPFWNGNPHANRSKVWAFGLRNPFRIDVGGSGAVVYAGDVGWNRWEELDAVHRGGNYGWPCYEGFDRLSAYAHQSVCEALYARRTARPPVLAHEHPGAISIIGGPVFNGAVVYADFDNDYLRSVRVGAAGRAVQGSDRLLVGNAAHPVQIRIGPDGALYYLSFVGGALHRVRSKG
jgi:glucose/arabinose dehydrogenase